MVRTTFSAMLAAVAAGVLIASAPAFAQQSGSKDFTPTVGQPGKDVVWVPTPDEVVERMLRMAQVTSRDVVYDLGSGDGRTVIAAQKKFGARAKGIEFNPEMVELSRKNAAREGAKVDPVWWECADEMVTVVPGLALAFLETVVMAAIALAVSTRLGTVANLIICFAIYSLGHLVPLIVQSSVGKFAIVRFTGRLFATLLPVLDHFTVEAAVVGGVPIPWDYLGWAALYAALYSAVAILLALVLFQHRDLA